ncbi:MAG TPA: S8 family serine peptidase [Gaiellaceae bacterium]|jgi:hypothetical protein|nr:S8 family serine peptidase [Gaiellaceae bacterium]
MKSLPLILVAAVCAVAVAVAAPAALSKPAPATHVTVAIVDTGVTPSKQLAGKLVPGWDFIDNDATPTDGYGHGTELASIIASECSACRIMPVRVLGQGGLGQIPTVIQGIQWAAAHGAKVINVSITTPFSNPDFSAAIEAAVSEGITVTVAAGNQGATTAYPGTATPDAIVVGSIDSNGQRFSWSNYGPWVKVVAPGALPARSMAGRLVSAVGTSASAAYVAGAAGNLLACSPTLAPAAVAQRLEASLTSASC